jgi:nucleoside phosphorylase
MATSVDKTIGLVIPTRWEARDVFSRFHFRRAQGGLWRAEISGHLVYACISGVGQKAAARAAAKLVAEGARELVSMGFCGALVPELRVGDLVTDRIATVDKPARTMEERSALTQRANAVAVDMETQAVIETGTRLGVPIRILRVVSDRFDDDLTPLFGTNGSFSGWRIALHLFNPKAWPLALRLRQQSQIAGARLSDALAPFLQSSS